MRWMSEKVERDSSGVPYLRPADHLAVSFELWAMEDFDAGDGLHGLPINRTDDTENAGKSHVIHKN